jgi:hypothetical protein
MSADQALKAELDSLRRRVRGLAILAGCALFLAGAALWAARRRAEPAAPAGEPGVLMGQSLYLGDDPDLPYVRLKYLHDGAGLILADDTGKGQAHLTTTASGGRLALGSPPRAVLSGDAGGPSLVLCDSRGRRRIAMTAGDATRITLLDERERVRLELSAGANGGRLRLLGERGEVVFEAPLAGKP